MKSSKFPFFIIEQSSFNQTFKSHLSNQKNEQTNKWQIIDVSYFVHFKTLCFKNKSFLFRVIIRDSSKKTSIKWLNQSF